MVAKLVSIARGQFYYGWTIVAVGFAIGFMVISFRMYGFGAFVKPMSEDLGWSRVTISGVLSFSTLVDGVVALLVGPFLDKRGARILMIGGVAIAGAGFIALGFTQSIWDFYFIRGVVIAIGFTCAGPLAISVAISNWFIRKRGRALSLGLMGASLGGGALTPVAAYLIAVYGWRATWMIAGVAMLFVAIPPAALFMKRRPEDIGLLPDGDTLAGVRGQGTGASGPAPVPHPEETWTRPEAMRTSALWLTILACGLGSMAATAMAIHFLPYLSDVGLTEIAAAAVYSVYALSAAIFKPAWGYLIDKYTVRRCGTAAFALAAVALPLVSVLSRLPSLWLIYPAAILAGISIAGQVPIQEVLWANYFGRLSLGAVRSIASPFAILFSAGGPIFAGWAFDSFGSYVFAWAAFAVTYVVAAALIYLSRPPKKTLPRLA